MSTRKTKESDRFKGLVKEYDHAPEVQDRMKLAFAEGYAANERKESENLTGWSRKALKFVWYGLAIWLAFQLIQGYSAIGGSKILYPHKI